MDAQQHIRILQTAYAGALADAVKRYGDFGVADQVTGQKRTERMAGGAAQAEQMGITSPQAAFTTSAALFGCADWSVMADGDGGFDASATQCMLCAFAKKLGAPSPCRIFCLDPIESIVVALQPGANFDAQETLYEGQRCHVRVTAA